MKSIFEYICENSNDNKIQRLIDEFFLITLMTYQSLGNNIF